MGFRLQQKSMNLNDLKRKFTVVSSVLCVLWPNGSDVNKDVTFKAKAKDLTFKAKAKDVTAFTVEYFIDTFNEIHFKKYA